MFCVNFIKRNDLDLVLLRNTSETLDIRCATNNTVPKIAELWNFFSQKSHGKNQKVHGKKLDICLKNASNFSLYRRGYIRFARGL